MSKKVSFKIRKKYIYAASVMLLITSLVSIFSLFFVYFYGRIYPGVYVLNTHLGGLTKTESLTKIENEFYLPSEISVNINEKKFVIPTDRLEASIDSNETVNLAYNVGRKGGVGENIRLIYQSLIKTFHLEPSLKYNKEKLKEQISLIVSQIGEEPQEALLVFTPTGVEYKEAKPGSFLNQDKLEEEILSSLKEGNETVVFQLEYVDPTLSSAQKDTFIERGQRLAGKTILLTSPDKDYIYKDQQFLNLINPKGGYKFGSVSPSFEDIANTVKSVPQNPVFKFLPAEAGEKGKVVEFLPAKDGLEVDTLELSNKVETALKELEVKDIDSIEVEIPLKRTPPDFATDDINDLGIKELIGVGTSSFRGSIPSRVYNIAHAASKLNGVLIPPGEIFSFNKTIGDISALTGYKQAYVIQGNQTVLGDGGGVCQVSTTFFRAAINAGLPIVERRAHSYRVGYYEQGSPPGIDAAIYYPTVDIKIKNDTTGNILIQTFVDTKNMALRFEFYGTSDGRVATISKPVMGSIIAPPEDLYIDDPTLPTGEIKQIDSKAWGGKVNFNYKVERNGETIFEETYYSNYRPWQAKFLRGTGPVQQ